MVGLRSRLCIPKSYSLVLISTAISLGVIDMLTKQCYIKKESDFLVPTFFLPVTFHSFRISTALPEA